MGQANTGQEYSQGSNALRVFISYSRKDYDFTRRLADELTRRGFESDYDQATYDPDNIASGIAAEDEWWQRLQNMIAVSDVMVFVVTPESASSRVCDEEIAWARGLSKRIIPILRKPIAFAKAPPRLSALNIKLSFLADDEADFRQACDELARVLNRNVAWYRENTRLTTLLARWLEGGETEARLLSAADLDALSKLLEERPRDAPEPAAALLEFRDRSRERQETERNQQRRTIGRAFVKPALEALKEQRYDAALRLSAAGMLLAKDSSNLLVPELWAPAINAIRTNRAEKVLIGHARYVDDVSFSPDGARILTASSDNTARVWNATSGVEMFCMRGHSNRVTSAGFSSDGTRIATASHDYTVRVWDASNGNLISVLEGHEIQSDFMNAGLGRPSFSPDGGLIVTSADDASVRIWETSSGHCISQYNLEPGTFPKATFGAVDRILMVYSVSGCQVLDPMTQRTPIVFNKNVGPVIDAQFFDNDRKILCLVMDGTVRVWEVQGGEIAILIRRGIGAPKRMYCSPDGNHVAIVAGNDTVSMWDTRSGRQLYALSGDAEGINALAFSPDGSRIVTSSNGNEARVRDAISGQELFTITGHEGSVYAACFAPDGKHIVTGASDGTARLWDASTELQVSCLEGHGDWVNDAWFSSDGQRMFTASSDKSMRIWNSSSGACASVLQGHDDWITCSASSVDDSKVVTGSRDKRARVWNGKTGEMLALLDSHMSWVLSASFDLNGQRVVTGSSDNSAKVWDALTGNETLLLEGHAGPVQCARFSHDGARIVTASSDGTARTWSSATGKPLFVLSDHTAAVHSATFSLNDELILTSSADKTALVWYAANGERAFALRSHNQAVRSAAFNSAAGCIVTSDNDTTVLWDNKDGRKVAAFKGGVVAERLCVSPDGKRIVTFYDNKAVVWSVSSGEEILQLIAHSGPVRVASFSPDGKLVLTASSDGTARVWDVSRSRAFVHGRPLVLAAALAFGIGWRTSLEAKDLLMAGAPNDLFEAGKYQLGEKDEIIYGVAEILRSKLHANCYLTPKRFSEKRSNKQPVTYVAGLGETVSVAAQRSEVTEIDMANQQFVEVHAGIPIFRLFDGRYHVVSHFGVGSLHQARKAAEELAAGPEPG